MDEHRGCTTRVEMRDGACASNSHAEHRWRIAEHTDRRALDDLVEMLYRGMGEKSSGELIQLLD